VLFARLFIPGSTFRGRLMTALRGKPA